jgi:hypothetical protein
MLMKNRIRVLSILAASFLLFASYTPAQQEKPQKEVMPGAPVMWQEPADIASRNLFLGPGGEAMRPDTSRIIFVEEKESKDALKFRVMDGSNREWQIKIGGEAQAETAAIRLVWAAGYYTDVSYLVPRVQIEGKGEFLNVRFEARPKGVKRLDEWLWENNPFTGTRELQGLKLLLLLLDNWNLKNENNKILYVRDGQAGRSEMRFIVSDLDTKSGKAAGSKGIWHLEKTQRVDALMKARFVDRVKEGLLVFDYAGRHKERIADISVAHARWIAGWLSRLSEQQIRDACRAGNYGPDEAQRIAAVIRARINELVNLTGQE